MSIKKMLNAAARVEILVDPVIASIKLYSH